MDRAELAAAHDANFVAAMELLAGLAAGFTRSFGEVHVAATRIPVPFFNAIFVAGQPGGHLEDLRQAVDVMRAERVPFVVHVPSDRQADVEAAQLLGLVSDGVLPCFAMEPAQVPAPPADLSIARVDLASYAPFMEVLASGFGMPRSVADQTFPPAALESPILRGYLGSVGGRPVATAMAIRTGATLGVYSVATLPDARGRGHGTALTWATMDDADPGVRCIVLQASELGRPVYERMGFQLVREFVELGDA